MNTQTLNSIRTQQSTLKWYEIREGVTSKTMKSMVWIVVLAQIALMSLK